MSLGIGGGSQSQNTSQNVLSSGSTSKTLTPFQTALQSPLFTMVSNMISNPMATVAPLVAQAKNNITSSFSGAANALRQKFMGTTAGGASGKYGTGTLENQIAQQGDLSNADVQGAATGSQVQQNALSLGSNLLGQNFGSTTTGSENTTKSVTGTGLNSSVGTGGAGGSSLGSSLLGLL